MALPTVPTGGKSPPRESFSGAYKRAMVADFQPLGGAQPDKHIDEDSPVVRDDAPVSQAQVPQWFTVEPPLQEQGTNAVANAGGHFTETQSHSVRTGPPPPNAPEHVQEVDAKAVEGSHYTSPLLGAAGAANGGLRGDSSAAFSNPDGYSTGTAYNPLNMVRRLWLGRMRGALSGYRDPEVANGTNPSPDPANRGGGNRTSPFDPMAREYAGKGPNRPTQRHVNRPLGENAIVDSPSAYVTDPASSWAL